MDESINSFQEEKKEGGIPKAVIVVVILILLALGAYFYVGSGDTTSAPTDTNEQEQQEVLSGEASLSLTSSQTSYSVGDTVVIDIVLATEEEVDGTDLVIVYDDSFIEITGKEEVSVGRGGNLTAATYLAQTEAVFDNFPHASFGEEGEKKTFNFSGISAPRQTFSGEGVIASIEGKALKAGTTEIEILYEGRGVPTDSNVAFGGRDILSSVNGLTLEIAE